MFNADSPVSALDKGELYQAAFENSATQTSSLMTSGSTFSY